MGQAPLEDIPSPIGLSLFDILRVALNGMVKPASKVSQWWLLLRLHAAYNYTTVVAVNTLVLDTVPCHLRSATVEQIRSDKGLV